MEQNRDERCAFRGWEKASVQGMQSIGERRKVVTIKVRRRRPGKQTAALTSDGVSFELKNSLAKSVSESADVVGRCIEFCPNVKVDVFSCRFMCKILLKRRLSGAKGWI